MDNMAVPTNSGEMKACRTMPEEDSGEIRKMIGKLSEKVYTLSEQLMFLRKDIAPVLSGLKETKQAEKMVAPAETEIGQLLAEILVRVDDEVKILNAVRGQVSI